MGLRDTLLGLLIDQLKVTEAIYLRPDAPGMLHFGPRSLANFLQTSSTMHQAVQAFVAKISSLYGATRIQSPVWLDLTTYAQMRTAIRARVFAELQALVDELDVPRRGHFLSTALACVLELHTGWISTVLPSGSSVGEQLAKVTPAFLSHDAQAHPYDPLWAQLSDLRGCIGKPACFGRTIVVGRHKAVVCRLLYVLSYFIRCNEVLELAFAPSVSPLKEAAGCEVGVCVTLCVCVCVCKDLFIYVHVGARKRFANTFLLFFCRLSRRVHLWSCSTGVVEARQPCGRGE